ncbi:MAG: hypothetical protein DSY80_06540 [Desulfocapsa sp.]|nr:MAG: hypothetical protein DSY80_06540 [Desulfocapsa sp.]
MKNIANAKQAAQTTVHEAVHTDSELYKVGATLTAALVGAVGIWAFVCLSSAFMSEGPMTLINSLFGGITGSM